VGQKNPEPAQPAGKVGNQGRNAIHEYRRHRSRFSARSGSGGAIEDANAEIVLLAAPDKQTLRQLSALRRKTVWVIYPKGLQSITENEVLLAGRAAGLLDVKVASFSSALTALKFVPPRPKK
jgi:hypothetical protein